VTDAAFIYHGTGAPTLVEYGPSGALSHEPFEFVERKHVAQSVKSMIEFVVRELGVIES
jgi:acetylornithine deacetylase